MTLWTDDKKFMWYGRSGYHYRASLPCRQSSEVTAGRVKQFYLARRAFLTEAADGHITFTRGKRPWSWFMPSETRQPQSIDVTLSHQAGVTTIAIDYHVTNRFGAVVAPCMFIREVHSLQAETEKP